MENTSDEIKNETDTNTEIPVFKSRKVRNLRQRIKREDSDEELEQVRYVSYIKNWIFFNSYGYFSSKLNEMKEIQKLRERPRGVSIIGLALGKKVDLENEMDNVSLYVSLCTIYRFIFALFTERPI